jgi:hypothetical protein
MDGSSTHARKTLPILIVASLAAASLVVSARAQPTFHGRAQPEGAPERFELRGLNRPLGGVGNGNVRVVILTRDAGKIVGAVKAFRSQLEPDPSEAERRMLRHSGRDSTAAYARAVQSRRSKAVKSSRW